MSIGKHTLLKLYYHAVLILLVLCRQKTWVKYRFNKPAYQTWLELNGVPCIDTTEIFRNKSICTSRSFGEMVSDLNFLKSSVATVASSCANKLRGQNAGATTIIVFISSNRFREDLQQYSNAATYSFMTPTSDTLEITHAALTLLQQIFIPGIQYKKSGVIMSDIVSASSIQQDLFDNIRNRKERGSLMAAIDNLNHRYGPKTIQLSVEGEKKQPWKVKSEFRSPNYLTDFKDILTINI